MRQVSADVSALRAYEKAFLSSYESAVSLLRRWLRFDDKCKLAAVRGLSALLSKGRDFNCRDAIVQALVPVCNWHEPDAARHEACKAFEELFASDTVGEVRQRPAHAPRARTGVYTRRARVHLGHASTHASHACTHPCTPDSRVTLLGAAPAFARPSRRFARRASSVPRFESSRAWISSPKSDVSVRSADAAVWFLRPAVESACSDHYCIQLEQRMLCANVGPGLHLGCKASLCELRPCSQNVTTPRVRWDRRRQCMRENEVADAAC
eukprot:5645861-Pleurochrysis_carterae.AAC.1